MNRAEGGVYQVSHKKAQKAQEELSSQLDSFCAFCG
jgi:hypothetical protein